jgi:hypothetical protein
MTRIFITLIFAALCAWYLWHLASCVKSGELYLPGAKFRRHREPMMFWAAVVVMVALSLVATFGALAGLFSML